MRLRALVGAMVAVLLFAGCSAESASREVPSENGMFPITVTDAQGEVTIDRAPASVVVLGSGDAQIASALGANIVGAVRNPSSEDGNWTGVDLPSSVLTLDSTTPNLEAIAALQPDLILATTAQAPYGEHYDQLTEIAPTVTYKTALLNDSGDDLTELIGAALGEPEQAQALIEQAQSAIEDFRVAHPSLDGKSYAYGQYASGTLYLLGQPANPSAVFLSDLGLRIYDAIGADGTPFVTYGPENFDVVAGADVAMISVYGSPDAFTAVVDAPGLRLIDQEFSSALLFPNPATTQYLLGRLDEILP